jgi:hypothetical protein
MKTKDGKYRVTRIMPLDGTPLAGEGTTIEEARARLKEEITKYREALRLGLHLQPTGEVRRSPGMVAVEGRNGSVVLRQNHNKEVQILARPDVAAYIKGGRTANLK